MSLEREASTSLDALIEELALSQNQASREEILDHPPGD